MMATKTKTSSMFLGHFLGDALGLPYEWKRSTALYSNKLDSQMRRVGMYGRVTELEVGQVSDDSEMTIILANHLFKNNFYIQKEALVLEYIEWANHPTCFGMGKNTRQLFKGIKTYNGYLKRMSLNEKTSQSNGAMMRCSSLALHPHENEMMRLAEIDCALTNPHPIPIATNKVYLKILRGFLENKNK
jgi:ADP-ribosylglycohydrolase